MRRTCLFIVLLTTLVSAVIGDDSVKEHNYYWRDYRGIVPKDAINVTENLYVGQAYFQGILTGTFYPEKEELVTECRGAKVAVKNPIKILCNTRNDEFEWEYVNVGWLTKEKLQDMVIGGFEDPYTLYIGKVFHEGQWKIGKIFTPEREGWNGLVVWYDNGSQYKTEDFQILKYTPKPRDIAICNNALYPFDVRSA